MIWFLAPQLPLPRQPTCQLTVPSLWAPVPKPHPAVMAPLPDATSRCPLATSLMATKLVLPRTSLLVAVEDLGNPGWALQIGSGAQPSQPEAAGEAHHGGYV
jgi:hypothetical protein